MKTTTYKVIETAETRGHITEREINLLKLRLNRGDWDADYNGSIAVTPEQSAKGIQWILSRLAKRNGEPRKGMEQFANLIELAKDEESRFTFDGFANIGRYFPFYVPIYTLSNGLQSVSYHCTGQGVAEIE